MGNNISFLPDSTIGVSEHQSISTRMTQNIVIIWLDKTINGNSAEFCNAVARLKDVASNVKTFTDVNRCMKFIGSLTTEKVYMVISGSLGQTVVSRLQYMPAVDSVVIFCGDKKRHEQWAKEYSIVKGICTQISPVCQVLTRALQQSEQNAISISFISTNTNSNGNNLNELNSRFMYTQLLKEILLTIKFEPQQLANFISHCYEVFGGEGQVLKNANALKKIQYHNRTPIWWYTCESFLYSMLNHALRTMDVDVIIKMGFFISDLHRQIKKLHDEQFGRSHVGKIFTVYRGQALSKTDFDQLMDLEGGFICFNNFLSTSKDLNEAYHFARKDLTNPDSIGMFFVMTIDASRSTALFASINNISCHPREDEILFSMHTIFRVNGITVMDANNRLYRADLTLSDSNDKDLRILTDRIRNDTFVHPDGWYKLGHLLLKMGQSDKAEQIYIGLLHHETDANNKKIIYQQIGSAKYNQGNYEEAIKFYEKSFTIDTTNIPPNKHVLALTYTNLGTIYHTKGDNTRALSYYADALQIQEEILSSDHPDLAVLYNNIGNVYHNMGKYSKAILLHNKAIKIMVPILPTPLHPDFIIPYSNKGNIYHQRGDYSKALSYYQMVLKIQEQTLPPDRSGLAMSYTKIGLLNVDMEDYFNASWSYQEAIKILETLPSNQLELASSHNCLGIIYEKMGFNENAYSSYKFAVNIGQNLLPPDDPKLARWNKSLEEIRKRL